MDSDFILDTNRGWANLTGKSGSIFRVWRKEPLNTDYWPKV